MFTRPLSIVFVSVLAIAAQAQLPSAQVSRINYLGRYHGFGYSDGYHACKEVKCNSWSVWKPWESMSKPWELMSKPWVPMSKPWVPMSSLYDSPTPSFSNRAPSYRNRNSEFPTVDNSPTIAPEFSATPAINRAAPLSLPEWYPAGRSPYESDSPTSAPIQLSPSDRPVRALPPLGTKSELMPSLHQEPSKIGSNGNYFEN